MNWAKVQCKTYHLLGVGFAAAAIAVKVPCNFTNQSVSGLILAASADYSMCIGLMFEL